MNAFNPAAPKPEPELSRRQLIRGLGGGLVGAIIALTGLAGGTSHAQAGRVVSLRALMRRLAPDCDPAHGIRLMLPDDRPVISIRSVIRRYWPA